jgi:hypothetical protein
MRDLGGRRLGACLRSLERSASGLSVRSLAAPLAVVFVLATNSHAVAGYMSVAKLEQSESAWLAGNSAPGCDGSLTAWESADTEQAPAPWLSTSRPGAAFGFVFPGVTTHGPTRSYSSSTQRQSGAQMSTIGVAAPIPESAGMLRCKSGSIDLPVLSSSIFRPPRSGN